jgi:hypothetical protein
MRISVDTRILAAASEALRKASRDVATTAEGVETTARLLDWRVAAREEYHRRVLRLQAKTLRESRLLERHATFLSFAKSEYHMAEVRVAGLACLSPEDLLETLGDWIVGTFGAVLGGRISGLWSVFATQGLVATVATIAGWALTSGNVDRGEIEQSLQDAYLKEQLGKLHDLPGLGQADWDKADTEGKRQIIRLLAAEAAAVYGISIKVEFETYIPSSKGWVLYGSCNWKGTFTFNEYVLDKGDYTRAMETVFHELRHQYQADAKNNPETFLVDDQTVEVWKRNIETNYIAPGLDLTEDKDFYRGQPVEVDARDFGSAAAT